MMLSRIELGNVLRIFRRERGLTLAVVAHKAGCAESLISYVESGRRRLHPWLAARLDSIYSTGGSIAALAESVERGMAEVRPDEPKATIVMAESLHGNSTMLLPRRELLTLLGAGVGLERLVNRYGQGRGSVVEDDGTLQWFEYALTGFQTAARYLPTSALIDPMISKVVNLDELRRGASGTRRETYCRLQAKYAESLSWLSEEAGDLGGAMFWIDRSNHWGQTAGWGDAAAYSFVRRSMVAISFASDGYGAVDSASAVEKMRNVSPRIRGLAAKQMAFGYALMGDQYASRSALDRSLDFLAKPYRETDGVLGQRSVTNDALFDIFSATCDVYLGRGQDALPVLQPHLTLLAKRSLRTTNITRAKLVRALADSGQSHDAAQLAHEVLNDLDRMNSFSARSELRRALPALNRWHGRDDIESVVRRLIPSK